MLLEEFGPTVELIKGENNVVADALSCLDLMPKQHDVLEDTSTPTQLSCVNQTDIDEIIKDAFPMSPKGIRSHQKKDKKITKKSIGTQGLFHENNKK